MLYVVSESFFFKKKQIGRKKIFKFLIKRTVNYNKSTKIKLTLKQVYIFFLQNNHTQKKENKQEIRK